MRGGPVCCPVKQVQFSVKHIFNVIWLIDSWFEKYPDMESGTDILVTFSKSGNALPGCWFWRRNWFVCSFHLPPWTTSHSLFGLLRLQQGCICLYISIGHYCECKKMHRLGTFVARNTVSPEAQPLLWVVIGRFLPWPSWWTGGWISFLVISSKSCLLGQVTWSHQPSLPNNSKSHSCFLFSGIQTIMRFQPSLTQRATQRKSRKTAQQLKRRHITLHQRQCG